MPALDTARPATPASRWRPHLALPRWVRQLGISHKLAAIVLGYAVVVIGLLVVVMWSLRVTDAVRGYVSGEGTWSKAQKSAVYYLSRYAYSLDPADFALYRENVNVTLAFRQAREELQKPQYSPAIVHDGWVRGGIPAQEIPNLSAFFRRFADIGHMRRAIAIWQEGDRHIEELMALADYMYAAHPDEVRRQTRTFLAQIKTINDQLTPLAAEFSSTLSAGARWVHGSVLGLILLAAGALLIMGLWISIALAREIREGIEQLRRAAQHMAQGDLAYRIESPGQDELGELARSFNDMIRLRQQAENALARHAHELEMANAELARSNEALRHYHEDEAAEKSRSMARDRITAAQSSPPDRLIRTASK